MQQPTRSSQCDASVFTSHREMQSIKVGASRRIRDGQLIRVDGDAGTVEVLEPALEAIG